MSRSSLPLGKAFPMVSFESLGTIEQSAFFGSLVKAEADGTQEEAIARFQEAYNVEPVSLQEAVQASSGHSETLMALRRLCN